MGDEVNVGGLGFDKSVLNLRHGVNEHGKRKTPCPQGRIYGDTCSGQKRRNCNPWRIRADWASPEKVERIDPFEQIGGKFGCRKL